MNMTKKNITLEYVNSLNTSIKEIGIQMNKSNFFSALSLHPSLPFLFLLSFACVPAVNLRNRVHCFS